MSSLRFSKGKTAIDFSRIAGKGDTDAAWRLDSPKYTAASTSADAAAMPLISSSFLFAGRAGAIAILADPDGS